MLIGFQPQLRLHSQHMCAVSLGVCEPTGRRVAVGEDTPVSAGAGRIAGFVWTVAVQLLLRTYSSKCWLSTLNGGAGCAVVEQALPPPLAERRFADLSLWETLAASFRGLLGRFCMCDCAALRCVCRAATLLALVVPHLLLQPHDSLLSGRALAVPPITFKFFTLLLKVR